MKSKHLFIIIVVLILMSLPDAARVGAQSTENPNPSAGLLETANLPWHSGYIASDLELPLSVGNYVSMAIRPFDNKPYISFYNQTEGALMLAFPLDLSLTPCPGSHGWNCSTLDGGVPGSAVGKYTSIDTWGTVDNWRLGISYQDLTNRALKVKLETCQPPDPCTWYTATLRSPESATATEGLYTTLRFNSFGLPVISSFTYDSVDGERLWYIFPVFSGGNCGEGPAEGTWQCVLIHYSQDVGYYASMDLGADVPYISYYDEPQKSLSMAHYTGDWTGNCGPLDSWTCERLDYGFEDPGYYTSISMGATYHIAYYEKNAGLLLYDDPYGQLSVDWMGVSQDPMGISIGLSTGYPVIAYQKIIDELTPPALWIARPAVAYGGAGNCGPDDSWRCFALDNGSGYSDEAYHVSLALTSSRLTYVAYTEYDNYYGATSLKMMYQYIPVFLPIIEH